MEVSLHALTDLVDHMIPLLQNLIFGIKNGSSLCFLPLF
jgi:hypothetical protein